MGLLHTYGRWAALAALVFFTAQSALCQGAPPGPITPAPGVQPEQAPVAQLPSQAKNPIRVEAREVSAPVTVTDKSGDMILNLKQQEFHVFDNGVEQKIQHFGLGGEALSIVLLIETSARVAPLLPAVRKAGIVFAEPVMGQTAEAAVLGYDSGTEVLAKFTTDPDAVQTAVNHLPTGTGGAHLYDAIARGIAMLEERPGGQRRILLVVGEAQDTGSSSRLGEVLRRAERANVTIYSVGLSTTAAALRSAPEESTPPHVGPPGNEPLPTGENPQQAEMEREMQQGGDLMALAVWLLQTGKNAIGPNSLAVASKATGGLHVNTRRDRAIEQAIDAIGGELHAQYTISYRPQGEDAEGYHEIKVTVDRPAATVRTRPGYYLAAPDP